MTKEDLSSPPTEEVDQRFSPNALILVSWTAVTEKQTQIKHIKGAPRCSASHTHASNPPCLQKKRKSRQRDDPTNFLVLTAWNVLTVGSGPLRFLGSLGLHCEREEAFKGR